MLNVSDHAVVRYLERVYKINLEEVRNKIREMLPRGTESTIKEGEAVIRVRGTEVIIREGTIVTLYEKTKRKKRVNNKKLLITN